MEIIYSEYTDPISQIVTEYVTIDKGNGEFTFMTKENYNKHQAEQSTPNLAD
jgi:hypothetical protein